MFKMKVEDLTMNSFLYGLCFVRKHLSFWMGFRVIWKLRILPGVLGFVFWSWAFGPAFFLNESSLLGAVQSEPARPVNPARPANPARPVSPTRSAQPSQPRPGGPASPASQPRPGGPASQPSPASPGQAAQPAQPSPAPPYEPIFKIPSYFLKFFKIF